MFDIEMDIFEENPENLNEESGFYRAEVTVVLAGKKIARVRSSRSEIQMLRWIFEWVLSVIQWEVPRAKNDHYFV
jgi:hypothetical protein